jgi:hypothetical protein
MLCSRRWAWSELIWCEASCGKILGPVQSSPASWAQRHGTNIGFVSVSSDSDVELFPEVSRSIDGPRPIAQSSWLTGGHPVTVHIEEVLRRSHQGMTRPFICRGDDGATYFVKGVGAGRRSQIAEWVAGNLGLALGLPIAPFSIVEVPEELIMADSPLRLADLGSGPAFGSLLQEAMELTPTNVSEVPDDLQRDLLAFDWWIRNDDRNLTETGGNPNLFWEPSSSGLVVIDHNQAFDPNFDPENFLKYHVFAAQQTNVFGDMHRRREYTTRFESALDGWSGIREAIPLAWLFADSEMTVAVNFDVEAAYRLLKRYTRDDFWNVP